MNEGELRLPFKIFRVPLERMVQLNVTVVVIQESSVDVPIAVAGRGRDHRTGGIGLRRISVDHRGVAAVIRVDKSQCSPEHNA